MISSDFVKMMKIIIGIFALICSAYASGSLSIIDHPKSLIFEGNEPLTTHSIDDVLGASLGYSIIHPSDWTGLVIANPFEPAEAVVTLIVNGIDKLDFGTMKPVTYELIGNNAQDSLDSLLHRVKEHNGVVADLDLSQGLDALSQYSPIFGSFKGKPEKTVSSLKPQSHSEDKLFMEQMAILNELADKFASGKNLPTLTEIHISILPLVSTHSASSAAVADALKMISETASKLANGAAKGYSGNAVVAVITNSEHMKRMKRATTGEKQVAEDGLNLAVSYSENYPVIFNIILWFGVVFAFSLLAISYTIGYMDPGRDSIIYRMTSNRIKKDN